MNCRNCGMPLTRTKCEYCDTDYSSELRRFMILTQPQARVFNPDPGPCLLFANDKPIALRYGGLVMDCDGIIYDEDKIELKPLSDTTLTTSSVWRWNV